MLSNKATHELKTKPRDDDAHDSRVNDALEKESTKCGSNMNFSTTDESIEFIRELILENEET